MCSYSPNIRVLRALRHFENFYCILSYTLEFAVGNFSNNFGIYCPDDTTLCSFEWPKKESYLHMDVIYIFSPYFISALYTTKQNILEYRIGIHFKMLCLKNFKGYVISQIILREYNWNIVLSSSIDRFARKSSMIAT